MKFFSCDGTFEKTPPLFKSIYSVHALHLHLPEKAEASLCAFALLSGKSEVEYSKVFEILSQKVQQEFGDMGSEKVY